MPTAYWVPLIISAVVGLVVSVVIFVRRGNRVARVTAERERKLEERLKEAEAERKHKLTEHLKKAEESYKSDAPESSSSPVTSKPPTIDFGPRWPR